MAVVTTNLGPVTAYADAVAGGYKGTREEWQALMASYASVAQEAAQSAQTATDAASSATDAASSASQSASDAEAAADSINAPDKTLTIEGRAADAKETGTRFQNFANALNDTNIALVNHETQANANFNSIETAIVGIRTDAQKMSGEIADVKSDLDEAQKALSTKAEIDGAYESMTVGNAEQIISTQYVEDAEPYLFRTTGGSADVGNRAYIDAVVGGSVVWNQLVQNGNFATTDYWSVYHASKEVSGNVATITVTADGNGSIYQTIPIISEHKYIATAQIKSSDGGAISFRGDNAYDFILYSTSTNFEKKTILLNAPSSGNFRLIITGYSANQVLYAKDVMCIDLTAMFGSTIADYIYSLEQATAGAGVAWFRKYFPDNYYPYSAPTLRHVEGVSQKEVVGFNQWDEEWRNGYYDTITGNFFVESTRFANKNPISVFPNTTYFIGCSVNATWQVHEYDSNNKLIGTKLVTNAKFTTSVSTAFINFNSATAFYGETYNNDICINLSWSGTRNGEYEPYVKHSYPLDSSLTLRGIPKVDESGNLYYDGDRYLPDGTVQRRYGIVDLGTLNWTYNSPGLINARFIANESSFLKGGSCICDKFVSTLYANVYNGIIDNSLSIHPNANNLEVKCTAYTDTASFKAAVSGVMLVYELATPTTEEADPYQHVQIVDDWGTEQYASTSIIPVGHETRYPANLRDKLQHLPDMASADGYYLIQQTGTQMELVNFRIPQAPSTDGTYTLKATVSGGTPTYTWVNDSQEVGS